MDTNTSLLIVILTVFAFILGTVAISAYISKERIAKENARIIKESTRIAEENARISEELKRQSQEKPTVYFVAPPKDNLFWMNLMARLERAVIIEKYNWKLFVPPAESEATYQLVKSLAVDKSLSEQDMILLIPRELDRKTNADDLTEIANNTRPRIILIDQQPPDELASVLENPKVTFAGINNNRVGILAAFSFYYYFANKKKLTIDEVRKQIEFYVLNGPGGHERLQGFKDAIEKYFYKDCKITVETKNVIDGPRDTTRQYLAPFIDAITKDPESKVAIFSGNDETALSLLQCVKEQGKESNIFIVGCDNTPEMKDAITNNPDVLIATIDTNLEDHLNTIMTAIKSKTKTNMDFEISIANESYQKEFRLLLLDNNFKDQFWDNTRRTHLRKA